MKYYIPKAKDGIEIKKYTVAEGDNAYKIANIHGIDVQDVIDANQGVDWTKLQLGQQINIPGRNYHIVEEGETGYGIASNIGIPWGSLRQVNGLTSDFIHPGDTLYYTANMSVPPVNEQNLQAASNTVKKLATEQRWKDFTAEDFDKTLKGHKYWSSAYNVLAPSDEVVTYESLQKDEYGRIKDPEKFRAMVKDRINRLNLSTAQKKAIYGNIATETANFTCWKQLSYSKQGKKWVQGPGRGIFQFEEATRNEYEKWKKNPLNKYVTKDEIMNELNFVVYELNRGNMLNDTSGSRFNVGGHTNTRSALDAWYSDDVQTCVDAFFRLVEKAGVPHMDSRYRFANEVQFERRGGLLYYRKKR